MGLKNLHSNDSQMLPIMIFEGPHFDNYLFRERQGLFNT